MNEYRIIRINIVFLIFVFLGSLSLSAQSDAEQWVKENYTKNEFMIPMRDGVRLFTAVYTPNDVSRRHPILLTRTPYSCAPYGKDKMKDSLWKSYLYKYLKEGYIFIFQDVRGKWMSEGEFVNVRPYIANKKTKKEVDEASDVYDTSDWLINNVKNNNGCIGVLGTSYPGFYATMAAASAHPAIKAVSPQAPVCDWFMGDDFHHNGAFMLKDAFRFFAGFGQKRPIPTTKRPKVPVFNTTDDYTFFLKQGTLNNLSKLYGDSIPFWNDMMSHPEYDAWWQSRDARNACKNLNPAILVVGGLFDAEDCYGTWHTYRAIDQQSKNTDCRLVVGPWSHGAWGGLEGSFLGDIQFENNTVKYYQDSIEIPFFNYHLKGEGNLDKLPKATVFFSGENNWKSFDSWPSGEMEPTPVYLSRDKKLSFSQPVSKNSYTQYVSDPATPVPFINRITNARPKEYMVEDQRFAIQRPDVVYFQTDVLPEDLTLGGAVQIDLKVAITTTDADFIVKIIDVFPDDFEYNVKNDKQVIMGGYQMLVRGEVMRGKFRESFTYPKAFVPNLITPVRFELPDIAHTFCKGHRLMIQIQSSWFPLVDRNPQQFIDIYKCSAEDFVPTTVRIYHQADYASKIILPVIQK